MSELVVLIDEKDNVLGYEEKLTAHTTPMLHRAFTMFIYDNDGRILIHQRAHHKYHSAGRWTAPCCGHPRPGESYEAGAHRRLKEEMGFDCSLQPMFKGMHRVELKSCGLYEHEYGVAFGGRVNSKNLEIHPNPDEVADYAWVEASDLTRDIVSTPQRYTFWFRFMLDACIEHMIADPKVSLKHATYPKIEHKLTKDENDWIVIGLDC